MVGLTSHVHLHHNSRKVVCNPVRNKLSGSCRKSSHHQSIQENSDHSIVSRCFIYAYVNRCRVSVRSSASAISTGSAVQTDNAFESSEDETLHMVELLKLIALLPTSVKALLEAHPDMPHVSAVTRSSLIAIHICYSVGLVAVSSIR